MAQNLIDTHLKKNPNDSDVLGKDSTVKSRDAKAVVAKLNKLLYSIDAAIAVSSSGTASLGTLKELKPNMGKTGLSKKGETWDTFQNRVSRDRNQCFAPGELKSLSNNNALQYGVEVKLPPLRVITKTSTVDMREFFGETYQVRKNDTFKIILERLTSLRCDSSITRDSLLLMNRLTLLHYEGWLPLPMVMKFPKPKSVTRISEKGRAFIKEKEGTISNIYNDGIDPDISKHIWENQQNGIDFDFNQEANQLGNATIGIGHRLHPGHATDKDEPWIQVAGEEPIVKWLVHKQMLDGQIKDHFDQDIINAGTIVNNTTVPLNQNQFDALSSLAFNTGNINPVITKINKGDFKGACTDWEKIPSPYLSVRKRRGLEVAMFKTPV